MWLPNRQVPRTQAGHGSQAFRSLARMLSLAGQELGGSWALECWAGKEETPARANPLLRHL
jgi:hypothetical protein